MSTLPDPLSVNKSEGQGLFEEALFASHGSCGIVDLGASMSVIGTRQFQELCQALPKTIKTQMREAPCQVSFRFGNDSTVTGRKAVFFPIGPQWIKIVVVPSNTPFLIANSVFRSLGAVIDTDANLIYFKKLDRSIPIVLTERKLYCLDFQDLLTCPHQSTKGSAECHHATTMHAHVNTVEVKVSGDGKPCSQPNNIDDEQVDAEKSEPPPETQGLEQPSTPESNSSFVVEQHHGDSRPIRSASRSSPQVVNGQHCKLREHREDHGHEPRGTEPMPNRLRQGSPGKTVSRSGERHQVCDLVRRDVQAQSEDQPHPISQVHRAAPQSGRRADGPGRSQEPCQGQGGAQTAEPSTCGRSSGRSLASSVRRGGPHESTMGASPCSKNGGGRDRHDAGAHGRDGECLAADSEPFESQSADLQSVMTKHQVADLCEVWQQQVEPCDVFDPMFEQDAGEAIFVTRENNWVANEMWNYFDSLGVLNNPQSLRRNLYDVMEVYCSDESELTNQARAQGLMAERFCRRDGDLSTHQGRKALYDRLLKCLPRNLWLSPKCTAWCKWASFNMSKSPEAARKVREARAADLEHLLLCDALFQFQLSPSPQSHAHLEQPKGSQMVYQEELQAILDRAFVAHCDMCRAGSLKHPVSGKLIQKGTQIITTSKIMFHHLDSLKCDRSHEHDFVSGSFRHAELGRINVSQYTELYTRRFAHRIARCFQCISQVCEVSKPEDEPVLAQQSHETFELPASKRQKINGKQNPPLTYQQDTNQPNYGEFLQSMLTYAPKVGKRSFVSGEALEKAQKVFPDMQLRAIEVCKGADRCPMPCEGVTRKNATHRFSMGIHRHQIGHFHDDVWENWTSLTRKDLTRKCQPARLLVTLFGNPKPQISSPEQPDSLKSEQQHQSPESTDEPAAKRFCRTANQLLHPESLEPRTAFPAESPKLETIQDPNMVDSSRRAHHGPKFQKLTAEQRQQLYRMHQNLGHPDSQILGNVLRDQGWESDAIEGIKDMHCPSCFENQKPKIARPGHLGMPRAFNDLVSIDAVKWTSAEGMSFTFYHMLDAGTNFQVAFLCESGSSKEVASQMQAHWFSWAGPPRQLMCDSAGEFCSEEFSRFLQSHDIQTIIIPAEAHWQLGKCERHGAILQDMLNKYQMEQPITCREELEKILCHCTSAKNSLSRCKGYSPEILVLGKSRHWPASVSNDEDSPADFMPEEVGGNHEISQFHKNLQQREKARIAFIRTDHDLKLRRSLLRRARPERCNVQAGHWVMFWREGKGALPGSWHGPAKILMREDSNVVWLTHLSRLYRCAPEHLRELSSREAEALPLASHSEQSTFPNQSRLGTGVFQYHDITGNAPPPDNISHHEENHHNQNNPGSHNHLHPENAMEIPTVHSPANNLGENHNHAVSNVPSENLQPDSEPEAIAGENHPASTEERGELQPWKIPVPETDEELSNTSFMDSDEWLIEKQRLVRKHHVPRYRLFCPTNVTTCPIPIEWLTGDRETQIQSVEGSSWISKDQWKNNIQAHQSMPSHWVGTTIFTIQPQYVSRAINCQVANVCADVIVKGQEVEVALNVDEISHCMKQNVQEQVAFLASAAKKQRSEVKEKNLSKEELKLFQGAKMKEIQSWLTTETVRRIARNQIPEDQILRSRWVLTWKPVEPTQQDPAPPSKPKARLVILGYEDPQLESLARDSPTMGKDSRTLILQFAASAKWKIRSFDIQTAFLRGSRQDGRILGMEPPQEMRSMMNLKPWECCELLKSAYGLVNAPLLWYEELKSALLSLNFRMSPLDPCTFVLPRQDGKGIHGLVGVHVDDGVGAGDTVFEQAIAQLEQRYPFGSKKESDFIFTGIHVSQKWDGSIELDQTQYIEDIPSIDIERARRQSPELPVTNEEKQALRSLIGSIQYAATNTRPDLSAKLSLLQAKINCATIRDLGDANKLLHEAKIHKDTKITIKSIPLQDLRFVSFSDASFANRANAQSQKGCLILAASKQIGEWKSSEVSPLIWYSRKIARVVGSTLASETYALSGSVDLLSWMRIHWAWLLNPSDGWKDPEKYLATTPEAFAVVDCKSLYDLIQKTNIPQCQEHRVTLEALIIKERLQEGIVVKWVHSAAQLADSLTKHMDCTNLRLFLKHGRCIIHDVDEILKARADKRTQKAWVEQHQKEKTEV